MVANPIMVVNPVTVVNTASDHIASLGRSADTTTLRSTLHVIEHAQSTCLVDTTGSHSTFPFSDEVAKRVNASQRESTRKMYTATMKIFTDWLNTQSSPICSSVTVADFPLKLFKDGRAPSTIEGFCTAIADANPEIGLSQDRAISRLLQSFSL